MIGIIPLIGVLFIAFKLLGITVVATWSWWLVTFPLWGLFALGVVIMLIAGLGALIGMATGGGRK